MLKRSVCRRSWTTYCPIVLNFLPVCSFVIFLSEKKSADWVRSIGGGGGSRATRCAEASMTPGQGHRKMWRAARRDETSYSGTMSTYVSVRHIASRGR